MQKTAGLTGKFLYGDFMAATPPLWLLKVGNFFTHPVSQFVALNLLKNKTDYIKSKSLTP